MEDEKKDGVEELRKEAKDSFTELKALADDLIRKVDTIRFKEPIPLAYLAITQNSKLTVPGQEAGKPTAMIKLMKVSTLADVMSLQQKMGLPTPEGIILQELPGASIAFQMVIAMLASEGLVDRGAKA